MITIGEGQEMKATINSTTTSGQSRNKTIRYLNPRADAATDQKITLLMRDLMANSTNTYNSTRGAIDLGILNEE